MRDLNYYLGLPYTIEIMPDEDYYFTRVLELPGCLTYADSLENLSPMIEEAIRDWIEVSLENGEDIPEPLQRSDVGAEDVTHLADVHVKGPVCALEHFVP
jgi:predicted RNase H-like HicB family nuclease